MTTICLVLDVRPYSESLSDALTRRGVRVVGVATGVQDALQVVQTARPNVVLIDVATADRTDIIHALAEMTPQTKTVALGTREHERDVVAFAEAGASGFVTRKSTIDDLVATVERVARDEPEFSPRMAAALLRRIAELAAERRGAAVDARLTPRERDILDLIANGLSNKEIARCLYIEVPTVKNHVHNILRKLNVRRRGEAAAYARRGPAPGR